MLAHLALLVIFREGVVEGDALTVTITLPARFCAEGSLAMRGGHFTCYRDEFILAMDSPFIL
jgi:hypothetical protein